MTVAGSPHSPAKSLATAYSWMPALIAMMVIIALAIGSVGFRYLEGRLVASTGEALALATSAIADKLDLILYERYGDIKILAQAPIFRGRDAAAKTSFLRAMLTEYRYYIWLGVTDANGRIVAATDEASLGKDRSGEPWFKTVRDRGGIDVQDVQTFEETGKTLAVAFTAPITGPHGEFLGAVTTRMGLPVLKDVIGSTVRALEIQRGTSAKIEYQFLTRDGDVVADSVLHQEAGKYPVNLKQMALLSALLSASAQPGYVEEMHMRRHVPVVSGYAGTEGYGEFTGLHWGILVRMDRQDILAPINRVLRILAVGGAVILVPMLGFLVWSTGRLRREWTFAQEESAHATATEAKFRSLFEFAPDALVIVNKDGEIVLVNPQAEKLFGYAREELIGQPVELLVPEGLRAQHVGHRARYAADPRSMGAGRALVARRKDGSEVPVEISLGALATREGALVTAAIRDITERKRAQEALEKSYAYYLSLFDNFPIPIWRSGVDAKCDYFNRAWLDFTGRTMEQELGDGWADGVHPEDLEQCVRTYRDAFVARRPFEMEYRLRRHNGQYGTIIDVGRPILNLDGNFAGYLGCCYDITERKLAEAERNLLHMHLQESHDQLRVLARRLLEVQEDERRLLARELHDEIGQQMTAIKLNLQLLQTSTDPTRATARFQDSIGIVDHLLALVRARSLDLRPPLLDELGLGPALESFVRVLTRRAGLALDLAIEPNAPRLPAPLEIAAFRVVQESLTNLIRHAQATRVAVAVQHTRESITLTVRDNGRGFDMQAMQVRARAGEHAGLMGLRERIRLFGGHFAIETAPGRGTEIRVTFPLEPAP